MIATEALTTTPTKPMSTYAKCSSPDKYRGSKISRISTVCSTHSGFSGGATKLVNCLDKIVNNPPDKPISAASEYENNTFSAAEFIAEKKAFSDREREAADERKEYNNRVNPGVNIPEIIKDSFETQAKYYNESIHTNNNLTTKTPPPCWREGVVPINNSDDESKNVSINNLTLTTIIDYLSLAQSRGVFTLDEAAEIFDCVKPFKK